MAEVEFGLRFPGRTEALASVHTPPSSRLVADLERSSNFDEARDVLVEGDNLEVLRLLQRAYSGRVQAIYIDPPYNTGHDFVYRDRFASSAEVFLRDTAQVDEGGNPLVANPSTAGRYHSRWLTMMLPRLWLARQLLRDDGLLFVSIDDHEVHRLRMLLDEVFGEDCFVAQIVVVTNRGGRDYLRIATGHEYLLCYGASPDAPVRELVRPVAASSRTDERGSFEFRELRNRNPRFHPANRPNLFYPVFVDPSRAAADGSCPIRLEAGDGYDVRVEPFNRVGEPSVWRWSRAKLAAALVDHDPEASQVVARARRDGGYNLYEKSRKATRKAKSVWDEPEVRSERGTIELRALLGEALFDHPKPVEIVRRCIRLATDPDGLVLDFFAGSGTTAQAVIEQDREDGGRRRYVLVQWPEVPVADSAAARRGYASIAEITRARCVAASNPSGRGLRVFRCVDDSPHRWVPPATTDGPSYVAALREHARGSGGADPWTWAVRAGLGLHASIRRVCPELAVLSDGERRIAVFTGDEARLAVFEAAGLPPGIPIAGRDAAFSPSVRAELAARHPLWIE